MQQPTRLISTPFAQEGEKTEIQNVTGEFDNSATYRLGFPPLTMQSIRLGGKPPKGTDFNGVLFDITENISFLCKGGRYQYNAGLSTLIGGYPEGSNLLLDDNVTEVVNTVAGNQNNPNTDMTGWTFKPNRTTAEYVADASGETQQQVNYNGGSKWHSRVGGYLENERVVLANGDIVKSTVDGSVNDPNVDMTGWVKTKDAAQLDYSLLKNKITRTIYEKLYETWSVKDFGAIGDGTLHTLQEWVTQGKFSNLTAIQFVFPFVTSLTESIDRVAIQGAIYALPLNKADAGVLTPKGFANGGCIHTPRGRYVIDKKITMQRGLRLVGESRESSQLISFISNDSVLQYADAGRYIQDEIVIKNLSIWQDPSVVATAGAAIDVIEGAATVLSLYMNIDNVYIEGTYYGIRHMAGVGSAIRNSNISKCVNHGIYLTGVYSTTSTVFENTYSHQNGGDGFNIEKSAYIAFVACASDSNMGFGYKINQTRGYSFDGCGAEVNQKAALNLIATGGGDINLFAISNMEGVAKLESNVGTVKFSGGDWEGTGFAIRNVGVSKVHLDGTVLAGDYATNRSDAIAYLLDESSNSIGKLVGGTKNQWAIGASQQPDSDGGFTVGGVASNSTIYGFKANQQFTSAGVDRNAAMFSQFISTNTAVTYPLAISHFVVNASKGAASTIQRSAGTYIQEQTRGSIANANLMIDAGQGTVPVGNWSIYNGSARPNYYGGSIQSALGFGAFGVAPPSTKRSITGKKIPTTIAEQNIVVDSIVSALVDYGFVSDDRT